MARKTFNVLFFIKKARLLKNGEAPVCMRITVNGCMVDVLVKRSCPVNLWNQAKENSKGKDRMSVELNMVNHKLGYKLLLSDILWKSHATLTLLATQDLPTFGYNMIDPLKSWCWGSILFYPFKISRFS